MGKVRKRWGDQQPASYFSVIEIDRVAFAQWLSIWYVFSLSGEFMKLKLALLWFKLISSPLSPKSCSRFVQMSTFRIVAIKTQITTVRFPLLTHHLSAPAQHKGCGQQIAHADKPNFILRDQWNWSRADAADRANLMTKFNWLVGVLETAQR